jgi:signal transduction histidine kinase
MGMKERAHLLNGQIDMVGIKGRGTTVTVVLPHTEYIDIYD